MAQYALTFKPNYFGGLIIGKRSKVLSNCLAAAIQKTPLEGGVTRVVEISSAYLAGSKMIFSFFLPQARAFLISFSIHTSMRFLNRLFIRSRTV